ncbi:exodeoxyribonuclease V subunit beta [Neptunomonas marina]|uniref:RecBCD enzyme subunit RecB n=1 Tax=Neptunomonas marina TaxID=1815562 RepID=A0A437QCI9_9GAMM|nr:exodeoxyribonuclease V subunit beta [Neptunomonas marina]RVU32258.1 exodeoxyribonuclease V subunit beta [Neptunomonas marina]
MSAQLLDPVSLPIQRRCLIEASAGTGKTFTLAALYLRLLLGMGNDQQQRRPLGVEEILVVTFTEAATQELRDRIRVRIREARRAFLEGSSDDPLLQRLVADNSDHAQSAKLLEIAGAAMDQAAIFTIHGFCQRMLRQHAFESGAMFSQTLTTDDEPLVRQALLDFWRTTVYPLPKSLADAVLAEFASPDALLGEVRSYLGLPLLTQTPDYAEFDLAAAWAAQDSALQALREAWPSAAGELAQIIADSDINKRSYSKGNVPKWVDKVSDMLAGVISMKEGREPLSRFSTAMLHEKTTKGAVPQHAIFALVDAYFAADVPIKAAITSKALAQVRIRLARAKQEQQLLAFDDLLTQLAGALQKAQGSQLADAIRHQYPIGLIDEFQDTDPLQYQIFSCIYRADSQDKTAPALLMIGDPKQSIYAFRGADIFTYMQAKQEVDAHYTLETNWRSGESMVAAANALFSHHPEAFIYAEQIPFSPVASAPNAGAKTLQFDSTPQPALQLWLAPERLNKTEYLAQFSQLTAQQIKALLTDQRFQLKGRAVEPADIAVLVRDRNEAAAVQQALDEQGVASVFMSNRNSVFTTPEARELYYILEAVAEPTDERLLRTAIATSVFQLSVGQLEALFQDELAWEALVLEFRELKQVWQRLGVLAMLHQLLVTRELTGGFLASASGERRLTDLLHLGELLQQASQQVEGLSGILRWLSEHLTSPNHNAQEQQLRLESDRSRVQVITIHKSKGLEYNLVFLPFATLYRASDRALYHDEHGNTVLNLAADDEALARADRERLAEDLRLLYVAVTRAVYGCYLGVADWGSKRISRVSGSALGYLLDADGDTLAERLHAFVEQTAAVDFAAIEFDSAVPMETGDLLAACSAPPLSARGFVGEIEREWRVTSYSALSRGHQTITAEPVLVDALDLEVAEEADTPQHDDIPDIMHFPRGAVAGTFLHTLFEEIDFKNTDDALLADVIEKQLLLAGFDEQWQPVLIDFMRRVLSTELSQAGCALADIGPTERCVEMEFFIPFASLSAAPVNRLLQQYDPLAKSAGELRFEQVRGMLKGFIDLTFRFGGRYYVLDYKSNHLGDTVEDYSQSAMADAMCDHRYDFQYVLYTLALHRLLKLRLPDYDYDRDIGGVYYLFLRGMAPGSDHGIYYTKPERALIEQLDHLLQEGV